MIISEAMQNKLNEQVKIEFGAEHKYLAMAAEFDRRGLKVFSRLFYEQAMEEHGHALKIAQYLMRVGAHLELRGVDTPQNVYESAEAMCRAALDAEEFVTGCINQIAGQADDEKDYATRSFIQWFVDEQVEEIEKMTDLLSLVQMAGEDRLIMVENRIMPMLGGS